MGWETSDRHERLPPNWDGLVRQVKERAGGRCERKLASGRRCPRPGVDADHIRNGDDHRLSNLELLCEHHHDTKSSREGLTARHNLKRLGRRPSERHPGDI